MAISKLLIPKYVDGSTKIMAADLNAIVSTINDLVEAVNNGSSSGGSGGGTTPTAPSAPTITINGTSATISAVSGATIKYTLDGSTPSASVGTTYSSAITLNASCTVKAVAIKDGLVSSVASKTYTEEVVDTSVGNDNLKWLYAVRTGGDSLSAVRTFGFWDITDATDFYIKLTVPESSPLKASVRLRKTAGMESIDMVSANSYDSPAPSSDYTSYLNNDFAMTDKGWITPGNSMEVTRDTAFTDDIAGFHVFFNDNSTSGYTRLTLEEIIASGITLEFRNVKKHLNNG